jgi:hypothetical protein
VYTHRSALSTAFVSTIAAAVLLSFYKTVRGTHAAAFVVPNMQPKQSTFRPAIVPVYCSADRTTKFFAFPAPKRAAIGRTVCYPHDNAFRPAHMRSYAAIIVDSVSATKCPAYAAAFSLAIFAAIKLPDQCAERSTDSKSIATEYKLANITSNSTSFGSDQHFSVGSILRTDVDAKSVLESQRRSYMPAISHADSSRGKQYRNALYCDRPNLCHRSSEHWWQHRDHDLLWSKTSRDHASIHQRHSQSRLLCIHSKSSCADHYLQSGCSN